MPHDINCKEEKKCDRCRGLNKRCSCLQQLGTTFTGQQSFHQTTHVDFMQCVLAEASITNSDAHDGQNVNIHTMVRQVHQMKTNTTIHCLTFIISTHDLSHRQRPIKHVLPIEASNSPQRQCYWPLHFCKITKANLIYSLYLQSSSIILYDVSYTLASKQRKQKNWFPPWKKISQCLNSVAPARIPLYVYENCTSCVWAAFY